jgi:NADPH-dependent curcumin reductase CurA
MTDKIVGREIHLKHRPKGLPTEDNFELVRVDIPEPKEGEFLVRNIWMSLDPHMRTYMAKGTGFMPAYQLNKPPSGGCVGQVMESRNDTFKAGDYVLGNSGWREYWVSKGGGDGNGQDVAKVDPKLAPIQYFLGILGITGFTAYVGLLKIGQLREGVDTVFVSTAAGGVGSIACQIAKIKGCYVVGSTGSKDKVEWLLDRAKVDYAFNYKKLLREGSEGSNNNNNNGIPSELKHAFPDGIDLYFDNVGGRHLEAAIENMNTFGRIVLCGATSQYSSVGDTIDGNDVPNQYQGTSNLHLAIPSRIRIEGFLYSDHYGILDEFQTSMSKWIKEGRIAWSETLYEGLENAPKAFVGLFRGENLGRTLVKIGFGADVS